MAAINAVARLAQAGMARTLADAPKLDSSAAGDVGRGGPLRGAQVAGAGDQAPFAEQLNSLLTDVNGLQQQAAQVPRPVQRLPRPDLDPTPPMTHEVRGPDQRPLQPRGRDLQYVRAHDRTLGIDRRLDLPRRPAARLHRDPAPFVLGRGRLRRRVERHPRPPPLVLARLRQRQVEEHGDDRASPALAEAHEHDIATECGHDRLCQRFHPTSRFQHPATATKKKADHPTGGPPRRAKRRLPLLGALLNIVARRKQAERGRSS